MLLLILLFLLMMMIVCQKKCLKYFKRKLKDLKFYKFLSFFTAVSDGNSGVQIIKYVMCFYFEVTVINR